MPTHVPRYFWVVVALIATACADGPTRLRDGTARAQLQKMIGMEKATVFLGEVRFYRAGVPNMPMYRLTAALAKKGLLRIDNDRDLSGKFTGWDDFLALTQSGVQRVASVALTPEGAKLGTLERVEGADKTISEYVTFVLGRATVENVVSNESVEVADGKYRVVMATYSFDLLPEFREVYTQSGFQYYRDSRIRALLKWDPFKSEWESQGYDIGPRDGDFTSEYVPTTLAKLRLTGAR